MIQIDKTFDFFSGDDHSFVFQDIPQIHGDKRGTFCEVLKDQGGRHFLDTIPLWYSNLFWIKQINRSKSIGGVIRGMHAQKGPMCQGKLVEAINEKIYDVIIDARPESSTFGVSKFYLLDPEKQNKLFVPRGFLHGFIVPSKSKNAIFTYYCDNTYSHDYEFGINPSTVLPNAAKSLKEICEKTQTTSEYEDLFEILLDPKKCIFSEKDEKGLDYETFLSQVADEYHDKNKIWYK